jgi:2',3'-cyclic-nucleotide 2'-phosphodiesterase (5'-nucleotidase family)
MRLRSPRHLLPGAAAFAAALLVALLGLNAGAEEPEPTRPDEGPVELQLLGVNDFHGHLEPPEPGLGGAAWLGAHLERAASSHPDRTITVHAGDMIGASPLISSHFHDEPTIEATNMMGFDVGAVGNHEFDEGGEELMRVLQASSYQWLAANTVDPETGATFLPPYKVIERGGVRVGFIGVTTDDTPTWLLPEFKREYRFLDISETVNRWVPELRAQGVEAIVVLAHSGAFQKGALAAGEIVDETAEMDDAVDVVVAGHTHSQLNLIVDGKLVVESFPYGTGYDRVRISVDRVTGDVVRKEAALAATAHAGTAPDPELATLVAGYANRVAPLADRVVGELDEELDSDGLGELAADAQRAFAGADVAFVNGGNTRRPGLDSGEVTYAEAFEVHAYEHPIVRMTMRGSDVLSLWRARAPVDLYESGLEAVRPEGTYTVAANAVLTEGRRFGAFARAWDTERVGTDLEALVAWLGRDER